MEKTRCLVITYPPHTKNLFIYQDTHAGYPKKVAEKHGTKQLLDILTFLQEHLERNVDYSIPLALRQKLEVAVLSQQVMPSMRCLMTAGEALRRENIAGYNCSYIAVDRIQAFDEILYILMNGTGVGFSVERQFVSELPNVAEEFHHTDTVIHVADSKLGWAKALKNL